MFRPAVSLSCSDNYPDPGLPEGVCVSVLCLCVMSLLVSTMKACEHTVRACVRACVPACVRPCVHACLH